MGLIEHFARAEFIVDAFMANDRIANCQGILWRHLRRWIAVKLSCAEPRGNSMVEQWASLWINGRIEDEVLVEYFAVTFQIRF